MKEVTIKRTEISKRLSQLENLYDRKLITDSKFKKARLRLIAELHTLDYVLNDTKNIDSDEWFKKLLSNKVLGGSDD